jgi:glucose/arabinose dehydrogenase
VGTLSQSHVPAAYSQGEANGPPGVSAEEGYKLEVKVEGLDFPTAVTFFEDRMWVSEAGVVEGTVPKVKEINDKGDVTTILSPEDLPKDQLVPPLTDVTYHEGMLWISHRQKGVNQWNVGAISKFDPDDPAGTFTTVITNLPASGDHFTEKIIFDENGRAYFSQGTATNSSIVGPDNLRVMGWLDQFPDFHDFPAKGIVLITGSA